MNTTTDPANGPAATADSVGPKCPRCGGTDPYCTACGGLPDYSPREGQ